MSDNIKKPSSGFKQITLISLENTDSNYHQNELFEDETKYISSEGKCSPIHMDSYLYFNIVHHSNKWKKHEDIENEEITELELSPKVNAIQTGSFSVKHSPEYTIIQY